MCRSSPFVGPRRSLHLVCVTVEGQAGKSKKKLNNEKLRAAAQLEDGTAAADSGIQGDVPATNGSDQQTEKQAKKKKKKKQRQQDEAEVTADATVSDAGDDAAPAATADQSAADRKAAKKQRRAEAKAAAQAQASALTGATAVAAPATDGNVGPDAAAGNAPPAKKAKVAKKTAVADAAMAAVGSRELAMLGAHCLSSAHRSSACRADVWARRLCDKQQTTS